MNTLYHYTTSAAFIGMITNNSFWASHLFQMNDGAEDKHGSLLMSKFLNDRARNSAGFESDVLFQYAKTFANGAGGKHTFSFSLSEKPDLLSQWRGYTPNGGYCVGMDINTLKNISSRNGFTLGKCIYDEQEQYSLISDLLTPLLNSYTNWDLNDDEMSTRCTQISSKSQSIRALLKHPSFSEEAEWRIFGHISTYDKRCCFRNNGPYIIPYAELPFNLQKNEKLFTDIYISPILDFERATLGISMLCGSAKMIPNHYRRSSCTLR